MPHGFCATPGCATGPTWPDLGWSTWNDASIYVDIHISDNVLHPQAVGEALTHWNQAFGHRILLEPRKQVTNLLSFYEATSDEWPFNMPEWRVEGNVPAGFAFNTNPDGNQLGISPGKIRDCKVYINRTFANQQPYAMLVSVIAHEIGHSFGLADHPTDDINSIMSYQAQGRLLHGPSRLDLGGLQYIYKLPAIAIKPADLTGIESVAHIWHYDRYLAETTGSGWWKLWSRYAPFSEFNQIQTHELYYVKSKVTVPFDLSYGRCSHTVYPNISSQFGTWTYD